MNPLVLIMRVIGFVLFVPSFLMTVASAITLNIIILPFAVIWLMLAMAFMQFGKPRKKRKRLVWR